MADNNTRWSCEYVTTLMPDTKPTTNRFCPCCGKPTSPQDAVDYCDRCNEPSHVGCDDVASRLQAIRYAIEAESISMGELVELQGYGADGLIPDDDVLLLEWAGVPEFPEPTWVGYIAGADDGGPFEVMGDDSVPDDSPLAAFQSAYQFWAEVQPVTRMHIRVFDGDDYAYGWDPTDPHRLEGFGRDDIVLTDRDVYFHRKG